MRHLSALLVALMLAAQPGPAPIRTVDDFTSARYKAEFATAHDGDTIQIRRCDTVKIRIQDIDAPELISNAHGKADPGPAKASRDYLAGLLQGKTVYVEETGESFDRKVARLYVADVNGKLVSVADLMTSAGMAKPYP